MTETKTFTIPPAFYGDHTSRDNGQTGRIVRETKRQVTVELDARAFADLLSDAELFLFNFGAGQFDGEGWAFGLRGSAARTIEILKADPFSAEELAETARIEAIEWAAGAEQREADRVAFEAVLAERRAELAAQRAAHPRVKGEYFAETARGIVIGIESNENLKVGTIIIEPRRHSELEVIELGAIERGGKVAVTLRHRHDNSDAFAARLELGTIYC